LNYPKKLSQEQVEKQTHGNSAILNKGKRSKMNQNAFIEFNVTVPDNNIDVKEKYVPKTIVKSD
jgi:hypothetical protein